MDPVKRIQRLMRQMGIEGVTPKRSTSKPAPGHRVYPYRRLEALAEIVERLVRAECFLPAEQSFACGDCPYGEACAAWHRGRARVSVGFGRAA